MRLLFVLAALACLAAAPPAFAGKIEEAQAAFSATNDADAVRLYTEVIAEAANDPGLQANAYFGRGEVHAANARTDQAIADFTAALPLAQDDPARANILYSRGEQHNRRRQYEPALADYDAALKLQPALLGVNYARGRAFRALNKPDDALKAFDAELKVNPKSSRALTARAELLGLPPPKTGVRDN